MIALTDFLIRRTFERFLLACSFFPGWMLRTISEPTLLRFAYIDWGLILRYFDGGSAMGSHWASHSACEIGFFGSGKSCVVYGWISG